MLPTQVTGMLHLDAATCATCVTSLNHDRHFRSRSMSQTFGLNGLDRILAGAGRQDVSFSFHGGVVKQRIDRYHDLSGMRIRNTTLSAVDC